MDDKSILQLIKAVSDSKLTFFELKTDTMYINMGKEKNGVQSNAISSNNEYEKNISNTQVNKVSSEKIDEIASDENIKIEDENVEIVKSPIVGTFYSSPSPDKGSFVEIGSKVKKGDALCIIEAMKLMNEIESEVNGEIVDILVKNEDMVEYGQPLFKVKK
ncbi:acetyl-CoA carboxylase biotin carboxyl carrier protein [Haloimpatiens sp. FM7330]|uniref:acetyl-CoA carboxylase biotin carboxyl carrier protein n=1 Tax=Haloimpatiens sp. FM7330 TaxID=3298610 RepID=UPI00363373D4